MYHIAISNQLFCEFSGPLVTMSTGAITVIHTAEVVHFHRESCCPYARDPSTPKHYQSERAEYTMKPSIGRREVSSAGRCRKPHFSKAHFHRGYTHRNRGSTTPKMASPSCALLGNL